MLSIVVPTFKEADNLPLLAEKIHACIGISSAEASVDYELIAVSYTHLTLPTIYSV